MNKETGTLLAKYIGLIILFVLIIIIQLCLPIITKLILNYEVNSYGVRTKNGPISITNMYTTVYFTILFITFMLIPIIILMFKKELQTENIISKLINTLYYNKNNTYGSILIECFRISCIFLIIIALIQCYRCLDNWQSADKIQHFITGKTSLSLYHYNYNSDIYAVDTNNNNYDTKKVINTLEFTTFLFYIIPLIIIVLILYKFISGSSNLINNDKFSILIITSALIYFIISLCLSIKAISSNTLDIDEE